VGDLAITGRQQLFASWVTYLLVDIVVLNLLVEFVPSIVIDSFALSILTAVLFRLLLLVTVQLEHRIAARVRSSTSTTTKVLGRLLMFLILFGSKFVILETVNLVFGEHVELGGVVEVILIAVLLVGTEYLVQRVFLALGRPVATG
jgi:hypothetical protein